MSKLVPFVDGLLPLYFTSKYQQRMRRLSCKIFNDFYVPELTRAELDYNRAHPPVHQWLTKWHNDLRVMERHMERPFDLNPARNPKYYPAHPQIRSLIHVLREYGLFRDEHRDFNEYMKLQELKKGKVFRVRRGPLEKKNKK